MPVSIYIPDSAFAAGGPMFGVSKAKATVLVGSANDIHPQPTYSIGGPVDPSGLNVYALKIRSSHTVLTDNQWNALPEDSLKGQLARLVAGGSVVVNDGVRDLTPGEIRGTTGSALHVEETDQAASTYTYPTASGFDTNGARNFSLQYKIVDVTVKVFGRNHEDLDWENITELAYDTGTGAYGLTAVGGVGVTIQGTLHFENIDLRYLYVEAVTADGTNTLELDGRVS